MIRCCLADGGISRRRHLVRQTSTVRRTHRRSQEIVATACARTGLSCFVEKRPHGCGRLRQVAIAIRIGLQRPQIASDSAVQLREVVGKLAGSADQQVLGATLAEVGQPVNRASCREHELGPNGSPKRFAELEGELAVQYVERLIEVVATARSARGRARCQAGPVSARSNGQTPRDRSSAAARRAGRMI
jgi:hypothetical protein